jgi:cytoskeletal protein RodZ
MNSILQKARIESGLTVDDIADSLKIRKQYIIALEKGDMDALPNKTYAIGYLKLYANYLGVELTPSIKDAKKTKTYNENKITITPNCQKYVIIGSIAIFILTIIIYYTMFYGKLDTEAVSIIENSDYVTKNE